MKITRLSAAVVVCLCAGPCSIAHQQPARVQQVKAEDTPMLLLIALLQSQLHKHQQWRGPSSFYCFYNTLHSKSFVEAAPPRISSIQNNFMRWFTILLLAAATISALAVFKNLYKNNPVKSIKATGHTATDICKSTLTRLKNYSGSAKAFALQNNLNSRYCFLIDMKIASGSKRFFIYDLRNDSILQAGLVTHGSGSNDTGDHIVFSNIAGSNCSSLGKYKTGKPYYGKFGLAYKLYGLEKTNSNAFNRYVVLHSHPCVPDNEVAPRQICESWGCPTISSVFLSDVKTYLEGSQQPILLWIFS